jgi:hypothetical protein
MIIRLPVPHPRFRPRVEGGPRRAGFPGTAVRIGNDLYEVVTADRSGPEWVYRLEPWPDQDIIRVLVEWGDAAEREFVAGLGAERSRQRKDALAWGVQPFLGFLPAKSQERLRETRGMDPGRATLWSAALETAVALPIALLFGIGLFVGGLGALGISIPSWAGALALAAAADGLVRLVVVISSGEPVGSLFLVFFGLRLKSEKPGRVPGDEILALEGTLDVVSPVRKIWWERAGGVTYQGESFLLTESNRKTAKFYYRFRRGGAGFPILDPELEKARNRSSDLSYVFAFLWGFLPSELQRRLEFYGRYKPRPNVIASACFNLLVALALVGPGLRSMSRGVFEIWSLALLAVALALFTESLMRLLRLVKDREISGSLLAFLVKPAYRMMIKDGPAR